MASEEPEVMKHEMEETRAALADKIHTLGQTVSESVQETSQAVKGTVEAVESTFESVKHAFDINDHVQNHPWLVMGCAVAAGYVLGSMLESHAPRAAAPTPAPAPPPAPEQSATAFGGQAPQQQDQGIMGMLGKELGTLENMAIGAVMGVLREAVLPTLTRELGAQMGQQVSGFVDSMTEKLGGTPIHKSAAQSGSSQNASTEKGANDAKRHDSEMGRSMGPTQGQGSAAVGSAY